MMTVACEKTLVLIFILCCFPSISSSEYIVCPEGEDCPTPEPCLTLQDYANNVAQYFVSYSIFLFLPGQHQLNSSLVLFNVTNLTLRGDSSGRASIMISGSLNISNGSNFSVDSLNLEISIGNDIMLYGTMFNISSTKFTTNGRNAIQIYQCSPSHFTDCNFHGSGTVQVNKSNIIYSDTNFSGPRLVINSSWVTFTGLTQFTNSHNGGKGGALLLEISWITLSGSVKFIGNSADSGGAIYLTETSTIELKNPLKLTFQNNSARTGGALTLRSEKCITNCFFMIMDYYGISVTFENNFAENGSTIYGGDLEYCKVSNGIPSPDSNGLEALKSISTFSEEKQQSRFFSDALKLCFCNDSKPVCSSKSLPKHAVPGREFNISIVGVAGQTGNIISAKVQIEKDLDNIITKNINSSCTDITLPVFKPKGYLSHESIHVWPEGCSKKILSVTVHYDDCPNGFAIENGACVCSKELTSNVSVKCDTQTGLINKTVYGDWIQPILDKTGGCYLGIVWSNDCPSGYCNQSLIVMNFSSSNTDNQCSEHRTGVLCGQCKQNYSLTLSNFQCRKCSNHLLGLLVFFAVAGLGLIILLLALNMTVASGTLNRPILYANIVSVYKDSFFPFEMSMNPLRVFISWMNLDFGIPLCFYDGLDAYQYFWLQYAFPLYLWFLIGIIILASRYSIRVGNLLARADPVAVLATIILMSYSKLLVTAVGVLHFINLHDSSTFGKDTMVWAFNGIEYLKGSHFILAIVAICVIAFLLFPYIFLLTFGYRLHAYTDRRGFRWFENIALFLNSYYAPFKNKTRYWSGFLLVVRVVIFVGFLASGGDEIVVLAVFVPVAIMSWLSRGTYRNHYLDVLESSFTLNICILSAGTYYIKTYQYHGNQAALSYICTGVAFVEFLGIVAFHLYLRLKVLCRCYRIGGRGVGNEPGEVMTDYAHYREPLLDISQMPHAKTYS